jgi:hypothetical protein
MQQDLYNSISPAKPGGSDQGSGELGALTLAVFYKSASGTYQITNGDLTLDAKVMKMRLGISNQHLH